MIIFNTLNIVHSMILSIDLGPNFSICVIFMIVLYVVCVIIWPIWQNYLSSKNWLVLPSRISPASFFFLSPGSSVFTNANNRFRQLAGYLNWHLSWSRQKSSLVLLPWIRMRPPQLSSCRVTVLLDWARVVSYLVYIQVHYLSPSQIYSSTTEQTQC